MPLSSSPDQLLQLEFPLLQVPRASFGLIQANDFFLLNEIPPKSRVTPPSISSIRCPSNILADTVDKVFLAECPSIGFLSANVGETRLGW